MKFYNIFETKPLDVEYDFYTHEFRLVLST